MTSNALNFSGGPGALPAYVLTQPERYAVSFLQGGSSLLFATIPMRPNSQRNASKFRTAKDRS
jgi:phosphoserine aminotransferase